MGRLSYLLLIAGIFAVGCYLGWLDLRVLASGKPLAPELIYGAIAFIVSAAVLIVDFRRVEEAL